MLPRFAVNNVKEALADTPVVFIMGPRQSGKTTLIRTLIDETWEYVTLDDQAQLEVARADPVGFVRSLPPRRVALGEHLFAVPIGALLHCTHTPGRAERRRRRSTPFRRAGSRPIRRRSPCAAR